MTCRCGSAAIRTLGTVDHCHECAEALLEPIRQRVILPEGMQGAGRQVGPMRPDHGPRHAVLECDECAAGWVGVLNEACPYCAVAYEKLIERTKAGLLRPTLTDDPARRRLMLKDWGRRLAGAVHEDLLSEAEARRAWDREVRREPTRCLTLSGTSASS